MRTEQILCKKEILQGDMIKLFCDEKTRYFLRSTEKLFRGKRYNSRKTPKIYSDVKEKNHGKHWTNFLTERGN